MDFNPLRPSVLDSLTLGYFLCMKRDYGTNIGTKKMVTFSLCSKGLTHSENAMQRIVEIFYSMTQSFSCIFYSCSMRMLLFAMHSHFEFRCIFSLIYNCFLYLSRYIKWQLLDFYGFEHVEERILKILTIYIIYILLMRFHGRIIESWKKRKAQSHGSFFENWNTNIPYFAPTYFVSKVNFA